MRKSGWIGLTAVLALGACTTAGMEKEAATPAAEPAIVASDPAQSEIAALLAAPATRAAMASIEAQRERNLAETIEITEIPAPPFKEAVRAAHFAKMLRANGLEDVSIDSEGNVIARRPGRSGARTVALVAHLDTVFPEGTDVRVRKEGNTYYAPGIGDDSRGLVVLLSIQRALNDAGITLADDLLFIGSVGEEGLGDLRGVKALFAQGGPKIDAFIGVDGGGDGRLVHKAVGSHRYRVTFKGPGGHSWGNFGEANPHHALARSVAHLAQRAPQVTNVGPKSSFSVGRIGGGTSINSIPFESWMEVDMRSGNPGRLNAVDAVFQKAITDGLAAENVARKGGEELTVDVDQVGLRPAGETPATADLVQRAMAAMMSQGVTPELRASSTDANIPMSLGIPAITMSRGGVSRNAHAPEESWSDEDSHVAIQILLLTVLAEAGGVAP